MFENLTDKLERSFKVLKGEGRITEINVAETLKEIRRALIDADVNYKVAKTFTDEVKQKAMGQNVLTAVKPGQMMTKIVRDELAQLMGGTATDIKLEGTPAVILIAGLQGSGKTTFSGKLASLLKSKKGRQVLLVAGDVYRPAAIDQLKVLGGQIGVEVYTEEGNTDPVAIAQNAIKYAREKSYNVVIVDTAGRLAVDEAMMREMETFVFALAYADLYNGGDTQAEIAALNSGEARYSDYMRPGFEFLRTLIDLGYIDAEKALISEAIEGESEEFLAGKTPIVMAYWGAANTKTAYGETDFEMQVIGFPSSRGQMPVIPMTGWAVGANAEHAEDAMQVMDVIISDEALRLFAETNRVISPSKNVKVDCVPALRPLNDRIEEGVYVLGSNAGMNVEQWGNTCLIVRDLLAGASVDDCMAAFDELQDTALRKP